MRAVLLAELTAALGVARRARGMRQADVAGIEERKVSDRVRSCCKISPITSTCRTTHALHTFDPIQGY